ncbi:SNF2-related protein, partial [Helicobacter baculiformis]
MSLAERKSAFAHFKAQELQAYLEHQHLSLHKAQSLEKAYNPSTGNFYTDLHALALDAKMAECGYARNQWVSLSRALSLGADPQEIAHIKANTRNRQNPRGNIEKVSISYLQTRDKEGKSLAEPIFNITDLYNVEVFQTLDANRFKEPNPQSLHRQEHNAQVRLVDLQNELKPEHYTQLQEYMQARAPIVEQQSPERVSEVSTLQAEVSALKAEVQRLQAEREADLERHRKEQETLQAQNTAILEQLEQLKQLMAQFTSKQEHTAESEVQQEPPTPPISDKRLDVIEQEERSAQALEINDPTSENSTQKNVAVEGSAHSIVQEGIELENTATDSTEQENIEQDFWTWQELLEEIEPDFSYDKEKMVSLYGEYFSAEFALMRGSNFYRGDKVKQKQKLNDLLNGFYISNPYYLPVYTIPEKLEEICVSLEQGKSLSEDAHLRAQLLEVHERVYYKVSKVGEESINPITQPYFYKHMREVESILAQIFEENCNEVFVSDSVGTGALPLQELNDYLIKGLRTAGMLYERDANDENRPFIPTPSAWDVDMQSALVADLRPLENVAQEIHTSSTKYYIYEMGSYVLKDWLYKLVDDLDKNLQNPIQSTPPHTGEDHERSEHRGVYAGDTKQYGDRQGQPMVGGIVGEVGETSSRIELTGEGILLESRGGGDEGERRALRGSVEVEHPNRLREGDGARARGEAESADGARGPSTLSGGNLKGDLSIRAHAHPPIEVGDLEREDREDQSGALGATDVVIQSRETGGLRVSGAGSLEELVSSHDLPSTPRHSVLHSARPNQDGVSDLGSDTGTDSARRGDNRYGDTPTSPNQPLSLFDHRPPHHREELQRVLGQGRGIDGTLQYESGGIDTPELNTSEIGGAEVESANAEDTQEASTNIQAVGNPQSDFKTQEERTPTTPKRRYEANVAAIKLLEQLRQEHRKATKTEQEILSRYSGWGSMGVFFDSSQESPEFLELQTILDPASYYQARTSTLDAYYTPKMIVDAIYESLERFGFNKDGNTKEIFEPSVGIGNFLSYAPPHANYHFSATETNSVSARITKMLHPLQNICREKFEKFNFTRDFDAFIGNPPYGENLIYDGDKDLSGASVHNYFVGKALKHLKEDGILAFVISSSFLDAKDSTMREHIAKQASFLGAIRLPNDVFKGTGTEVTTDLVFFKKGKDTELHQEFIQSAPYYRVGEKLDLDLLTPHTEHIRGTTAHEHLRLAKAIDEFLGIGKANSTPELVVPDWNEAQKEQIHAFFERNKKDILGFCFNEYFAKHPEHILGDVQMRIAQKSLELTNTPQASLDLKQAISSLISTLPKDIYKYRKTEYPQGLVILDHSHHKFAQYAKSFKSLNVGNYVEFEGEIYKIKAMNNSGREDESYLEALPVILLEQVPQIKTKMQKKRIQAFIPLRDAFNDLLKAELSPLSTDGELEIKREKLNTLYNGFVKTFGYLNENKNRKDLKYDLHGAKVLGLEREFDKGINKAQAQAQGLSVRKPRAQKADIFSKRTLSPKKAFAITNAKEALIASVSETGGLDLAFIAKHFTTQSVENTLEELLEQKLIFKNHLEHPSYVLATDYLSGNVKQKFKEVKQAIEAGREDLAENLKELEAIIPADIKAIDISVHLGTPWIPPTYYEQFLLEQVGENYSQSGREGVFYEDYIKQCLYVAKNPRGFHVNDTTELDFLGIRDKYNPSKMKLSGARLLECVFNNTPLEIKYPDPNKVDAEGKPVMVVDEEQSALAQERAIQLQEAFKEWIYADYERRTHLEQIYNDTFNTDVLKSYDGSHLHLEGFNQDIELRPHQKNAIFRAIQERTLCLDHQVGAGKTLVAIASCMEQKRMGLVNKSLIAVPNHLTKQWAQEFYKAYPDANVLVVESEDFSPKQREQLYNQIANNQYDAVIIAHSQLEFLANPEQTITHMWAEEEETLRSSNKYLRQLVKNGLLDKSAVMSVRAEEQAIKRIGAKYSKLLTQNKSHIDISQMGIDNLIVDEAHLFKNLGFSTNMQGVAGLGNQQGSRRASDLFVKTQYLHGKGAKIMFLTGTPIANSIAELYHLQRYLQPETLKDKGIYNFDDWAQTFGQIQADLELDTSAQNYKVVSRFSKFNGVQELSTMYRSFADVISNADIQKFNPHFVPKIEGGKPINIVVPRSEDVARFIGIQDEEGKFNEGSIVDRMEKCKGKKPEKGGDNILACTTDARKAALDYRLIDPDAKVQDKHCKAQAMAVQIYEQYKEWDKDKGTQLVFISLSTPKVHSQRVQLEDANTQEQENIQDGVQELLESLTEYNEQGQATTPSQAELQDALAEEQAKALDVDTQIAQNASFDVYSDVLRRLVKLGIPQSEIAFIHDAKTEAQKQELFKKVNSGEIRVLLGSPAKMGVGTNVQERLVAGHFLDCPWRPDELLQMEGRLIRQGNVLFERDPEHFAIKLFRYATKQTYDSRMWQIIESKSKSLEQFRSAHKLGLRELEDITMGSADASEMKALATGNPLIVQEVRLRQILRKEENLYKAFLKEQHFKQESLQRNKGALQHSKKQLDTLNALIERREPKRESVSIELYEGSFQEPRALALGATTSKTQVFHLLKSEESNKQNLERMEKLFKSLVQNAIENEGVEIDVMGYRGLLFKAMSYQNRLEFYICHPDDSNLYTQPDNLIYTKNKQHLLDVGSFQDIDFKSFLRKCNNSLEKLEKTIQREQEHQDKIEQEVKSLEILLSKEAQYPKLETLQALKEDCREIVKEIAKCSADKNYKSAFVARSEQFASKAEATATHNLTSENNAQESMAIPHNTTTHTTPEKLESKEGILASEETNIAPQIFYHPALESVLNHMLENPTFVQNFVASDAQNQRTAFEDTFKKDGVLRLYQEGQMEFYRFFTESEKSKDALTELFTAFKERLEKRTQQELEAQHPSASGVEKAGNKGEGQEIEKEHGNASYIAQIKAMNAFLVEEEARLRVELEREEPLYEAWMQRALEHKQAYWELYRQAESIGFSINRAKEGQEMIQPQELEHLEQEYARLEQEKKKHEDAFKEHVRFADLLSDEERLKDDYSRRSYLRGLKSDHQIILAEIKRTQTDPTYISTFRPECSDNASWHAAFYDSFAEERNNIT